MIVLGDFNSNIIQTNAYTKLAGIGLSRVLVINSTGSRVHRGKIGMMVDHIYHCGFQQHPDTGKVHKYLDMTNEFKSHNQFAILADTNVDGDGLVEGLIRETLGAFQDLDAMPKTKKKNIENLIQQHMDCNPKSVWRWIKARTGRSIAAVADGPIINKDKVLVTDTEQKASVWAEHFEKLAEDTTGNSRNTKKWKQLGINIGDVFPECNNALTWKDITDALKQTPKNKSPVARIAATKLSELHKKYHILVRDQDGYRTRKECVAQ
ncbi:hypothetical protein BB559_006257, partial [Furculomyces boomerangus]